MGLILDCACEHCDYSQYGIRLGSDMIMGYNYFPAYQALEKRVVQVNIYRYLEIEEFRLPGEKNAELSIFKSLRLIPYFEPGMFDKNGADSEIISEFPHLQSKHNYCPKCASFGLRFKIGEIF
ncbi:MAG TPA: hypothetical protein VII28_14335 [Puia sp.]